MAEREGFEPSRLLHPNALAKRPLRPLGYLSNRFCQTKPDGMHQRKLFPENWMRRQTNARWNKVLPVSPPQAALGVPAKDSASASSASASLCGGSRISPRPISIRQLHALPHFHSGPINLVVSQGSYVLGNLILRGASRLDAFSAYPVRTWLPSYAPGGTTGTPAVRPSRSSRTKDSSSQISCARDR
jgi:hypothetical protein